MNAKLIALTTVFTAFLVPPAQAGASQETGASQPVHSSVGQAVDSELVVRHFTPTKADALLLERTIESLFGDAVAVHIGKQDGEYRGGARLIDRIACIGQTMIIRDKAERAEELLRTLAELDRTVQSEVEASADRPRLESFEYEPKHVGLASLQSALRAYERQIQLKPSMYGAPADAVRNITVVAERNLVILREEPERLEEIKAMLGRVDVPSPEVVITCWLVRGLGSGDAASGLPVTLVANLQRLVFMPAYEQLAVGIIRSSILTGSGIHMQAEVGDGISYTLELEPAAYDSTSGELALSKCRFQLTETRFQGANQEGRVRSRLHEFQTQVALRPGEYTVLGTVGGDPLFVVLRLAQA
jgi:hypothetical protein